MNTYKLLCNNRANTNLNFSFLKLVIYYCVYVVFVHLKGHPLQVRHKQNWAEVLSFYYARMLYCLDQMLAVMVLDQHRVSSCKTVRPRAPSGAACMGHAIRTWSAVCSEEPAHSQLGEGKSETALW